MRKAILGLVAAAWVLWPFRLPAQEKVTPEKLPEFLANYDSNFNALDSVYGEMADQNLPLRDEEGKPLRRRAIEDRRQALADLRQTERQLAANPKQLVLAATLALRTEALADDLFDFSQIAYDNDQEELGNRLSDLHVSMDHNKQMLADYLLSLAAESQERASQLEREKAELERKLSECPKQAKPPGL